MGFGVLMGWAQVKLLPFANRSNLRTKMLPTIIKKYVQFFFGKFGFGKFNSNMVCNFVDQTITIQIYKNFIMGLLEDIIDLVFWI